MDYTKLANDTHSILRQQLELQIETERIKKHLILSFLVGLCLSLFFNATRYLKQN